MLQNFSSDIAFRGLSASPFDGEPPCLFGKRTVVYGRNGTGKTSLTEAIRLACTSGKADSSTLKARVVANGVASAVVLGQSTIPFDVFVYNRHYVQDSLQVFLDGGGQARPIVKLGAVNVRAEKELRELQEYLKSLENRLASLSITEKEIEQGRDTIEKETKANVIAALARSDPAYYNQTRFQVPQVRKLLNDAGAAELEESTLDAELASAASPNFEPIAIPTTPQTLETSMHSTINDEILGVTIESVRLPRLDGNQTLSDWVETGMGLHQEGDLCAFCQSGIVTASTLDEYRRHFSAALEALRERISEATETLKNCLIELNSWLGALPTSDEFMPDYREEATAKLETVNTSAANLKIAIDLANSAIESRLADPLNPRPESDFIPEGFPKLEYGELLSVIEDNNSALSTQADRISEAKSAVESHYGAQKGKEYRALGVRLGLSARARNALESRARAIRTDLLVIQQAQADTGRMANLIDADLRDHFGHAHLAVSVSDDGKGYVIRRAGNPADQLSEGERNAIAFTYFLRSLEGEGVDPESTVVIIDDPVTSLDKESLFAAFALANIRTSGFAQTIVLTHDYEYFRLQLGELRNRWHSSQKRIAQNDPAEKLMPAVSLLEVRAIAASGGASREGKVRELPRALIQHPSEYHFLFLHVAEAVSGNSQEYLPLVGNAGRRLLEGFLSFRAPSKIKFQDKVDAVASSAGIDESLKERVVQFLHSQSHREEPRPSAALDFPSIEAELVATLAFIQRADGDHFKDMCIAIGLDPETLIQDLGSHTSA